MLLDANIGNLTLTRTASINGTGNGVYRLLPVKTQQQCAGERLVIRINDFRFRNNTGTTADGSIPR